MSPQARATSFAVLSILWCGVSASAETLRCQSVNGNLNCASSNGVSCQTINGKKVCTSTGGDVVQSFGNNDPSGDVDNDRLDNDDTDVNQLLEQHVTHGHMLSSHQRSSKTRLRTDQPPVDRD